MQEEFEVTPVEASHRATPGQIARVIFLIILGGTFAFGFSAGTKPLLDFVYERTGQLDYNHLKPMALAAAAILGFLIGAGIGNLLLGWLAKVLDKWEKMDSGDKVTLFGGVFLGLLA